MAKVAGGGGGPGLPPEQIIDMKKRPPKLKSLDRSMSVRIDNYSPMVASTSSNLIVENPSLLLPTSPELLIPPPAPMSRSSSPKIFYLNEKNSIQNFDDFTNAAVVAAANSRRNSFRRSDTLDASSMMQLRKTTSFHASAGGGVSGPGLDDIIPIRQNSMRNPYLYQQRSFQHLDNTMDSGFGSSGDRGGMGDRMSGMGAASLSTSGLLATGLITSAGLGINDAAANRRNCHMHRSFKEPPKSRQFMRRDAIKCHSLNDEISENMGGAVKKDTKKFNSANASLENDLYRSRSNSRNYKKEESYSDFINRQNSKKYTTPYKQQGSHHSLDQQVQQQVQQQAQAQQQYGVRRGLLQPSLHLLAPSPMFLGQQKSFEEIRIKSPVLDPKKSYSLRYKQGREARAEQFRAKKSKSFIVDYDLDGASGGIEVKDEGLLFSDLDDDINRIYKTGNISSPNLKKLSPNNLLVDEITRSDLSPLHLMDVVNPDYDMMFKSYRLNRQKSSLSRSSKKSLKARKKSLELSEKKANELAGLGDDDDDDGLSNKKRKRIVCIVMTVFLILVILSVLAVVVTLTHSSSAHSSSRLYTFSRDVSRDVKPIHYNGST